MTTLTPRPIDPLGGARVVHRYDDDVVTVERGGPARSHAVRTASFATWTEGERVHVVHDLAPEEIDNDLVGRISRELFAPGWLSGSDAFERVLTGIVLTSADDAAAAWELFYRNTLRRLGDADPATPAGDQGTVEDYAPVYARATELVAGSSVLELGCCFGFLSLRLAERARTTASDVTPGTVRLLDTVAQRLDVRLDTLTCDAARVPRPDASYDTVVAVHLLEHLEPEHGAEVVAEMLRLARSRIVVAVPFEDEPSAEFGHVRVFDLATLEALGRSTGWPFRCFEHHGGWLVADRRC